MFRLIKLTLLACLLMGFSNLIAQPGAGEKSKFSEKLRFGGDIVLNLGNRYSAIGGSPRIGYQVTDRYLVGIAGSYIHFSEPNLKTNTYSGGIFNRFTVSEELFLHAEFEQNAFDQTLELGTREQKRSGNFPAFLVGGGFRQPMGNGYMSVSVLYDILQDPNSFYRGPIIRGGIILGR